MADNITFTIEARNQANAALGQAAQQVRAYADEIRKLRQAGDNTTEGQARLGQAIQNHIQAQRQYQNVLAQTTTSHGQLQDAIHGVTGALSEQAGPLSGLSNALSSVNVGAGLVVAGIGAVAGVMAHAAKETSDYALELRNMGETSGIAVNTLAAVRVGAEEAGKDFGQLQAGLFKLSHTLGDALADPTGEAAKTFQSLGVSITDASGMAKSGEQVFRDIAEKIENAGSASERSRIAFEAFGRGGVGFALILQHGMKDLEDQVRKMGLAMSPEAEQAALRFRKATVDVQESIKGLNLSLGGTAAGPLTDFNEGLAKGIQRLTALVNIAKLVKFNPLSPVGVSWNTDRLDEMSRTHGGPMSMVGTTQDRDLFGQAVENAKKIEDAGTKAAEEWRKAAVAFREWAQLEAYVADKFGSRGGGLPIPTVKQGALWAGPQAVADLHMKDVPEINIEPFLEASKGVQAGIDDVVGAFNAAREAGRAVALGLEDGFRGAIDAIRSGGHVIQGLWHGIVDSMANALEDLAVKAAAKGLIQVGAAILGLQSGGTIQPLRAQAGLVTSGYRGIDTVPVLVGRGEMIVGHADVDAFREVVGMLKRNSGSAQRAPSAPVPINVTLNISAHHVDEASLRSYVKRDLVPVLNDVMTRRAHR